MICWFRDGITDSFGKLQALGDGLDFIDASACPHYDGEPERRPTYMNAVKSGLPGEFAVDDGAALYYRGVELVEAICSRPTASAYRVELVNGDVVETRLPTRYLGS